MPWTIVKRDNEYCVYKKGADGWATGDTLGCHASREKAQRQIGALHASENMETVYLPDEYVSITPGKPFRLFPFGKLIKGGTIRNITKEFAHSFKLPHFKPPIKLGSHREETPAGGFINGLEVREDGLYAIPEFNEEGEKSLEKGQFRYHSPEVIWEDGGLENPETGNILTGPLIVGVALLHTPHLGENAALYSVEPVQEVRTMETVEVPKSMWDRFMAFFDREEPTPDPEPAEPKLEKLQTIETERDEYKAKYEELVSHQEAEKLNAEILGELQDKERFGVHFEKTEDAQEAADHLAKMGNDQREWVLNRFSAQIAQISESNLTGEVGSDGDGEDVDGDPTSALDKKVRAYMSEHEVDYMTALKIVIDENPELYNRAY